MLAAGLHGLGSRSSLGAEPYDRDPSKMTASERGFLGIIPGLPRGLHVSIEPLEGDITLREHLGLVSRETKRAGGTTGNVRR